MSRVIRGSGTRRTCIGTAKPDIPRNFKMEYDDANSVERGLVLRSV